MPSRSLRQAALFVAVSGTGWLLDTAVFLLLSGPGGWPVAAANMLSGSCGALLVFAASSRGIFRRNDGSMAQKVAVLLLFNAVVIAASSAVLALIAARLGTLSATWGPAWGEAWGWTPPPNVLRLLAKVLVTPVTLALNFVVVRLLLERFVGLRAAPAAAAIPAPAGRAP